MADASQAGESPDGTTGSYRLSKARLVEAALEIIHRDGLPALNMRALGTELGVTQMAAYHYVRTKEDLFSLVLDSVFSTVQVPHPESGPWEARLERLMTSIADALSRFPGLSHAILITSAPPSYTRIRDAYMQILDEGGISGPEALLAYTTITSYLVGRLESVDAVRLHGVPLAEGLDPEAASTLHSQDYLSYGVHSVVSGLSASRSSRKHGDDVPPTRIKRPRRSSGSNE